jgi:hypothetical protein
MKMNSSATWIAIAAFATVTVSLPAVVIAQDSYQQPTQTQRTPEHGKSSADEEKAKEVVGKLYAAAQADLAGHHYGEAAKAYEEALRLLEQLYGSHDEHLIDALNGIVQTRMAWDNFIVLTGSASNANVPLAVRAQERIVKIDEQDGADSKTRIAATIDLGDVYLYTDDKRAFETYEDAWKQQAKLDSSQSADAMFGKVAMVRMRLPANPLGHEEWVATVHYDVGADGKATVAEVTGNAPETLANAIRQSYADGIFRPRLAAGEPVATSGLSTSHKYVATDQQKH